MFHKHMSSFSYNLTVENNFQLPKNVFEIGNQTINTFLAYIKRPHRSWGGRGILAHISMYGVQMELSTTTLLSYFDTDN